MNVLLLKNVQGVEPEIKRAVYEEALARSVTMNDIVGGILAREFGADGSWVDSGEKTMGGEPTSLNFMLRLPSWMLHEIWKRARQRKITESSVVQEALARHFGLRYEAKKRTGPKRKSAEAAT